MGDVKKLNIWILNDGRRGHLNQSIALANAISLKKNSSIYQIDVSSTLKTISLLLKRRFIATSKLNKPDLIICTGHKTHLSALAARSIFGGKIILIMSPTLPLYLFDHALIPLHDNAPIKKNVSRFEGALSQITPKLKNKSNTVLIIIGGSSRFFEIDPSELSQKIRLIIGETIETEIHITDSPRTPEEVRTMLSSNFKTLYKPWESFKIGSVQRLMSSAKTIWVTEDSISMTYDALSTGSPVGIIPIQRIRESKVSQVIDKLLQKRHATHLSTWSVTHTLNYSPMLNEASRCADIILRAFRYR